MSLQSVLKQFGHWFISLFQNLQTAWEQEEPELQKAMVTASEIVQIIKTNLNYEQSLLWTEILQKTGVSQNVLHNGIEAVAAALDSSIKIVVSDPVQTLGNISAYLKTLTGNAWADKLQSAAKMLSAELAPGTPYEKISLFAQFVYTNFIQKH